VSWINADEIADHRLLAITAFCIERPFERGADLRKVLFDCEPLRTGEVIFVAVILCDAINRWLNGSIQFRFPEEFEKLNWRFGAAFSQVTIDEWTSLCGGKFEEMLQRIMMRHGIQTSLLWNRS
jgi:hypothetical protein